MKISIINKMFSVLSFIKGRNKCKATILNSIKLPVQYIKKIRSERHYSRSVLYVKKRLHDKSLQKYSDFYFLDFKKNVLEFVDSMQIDDSGVKFRYSGLCSKPTLYASAYACMTYSLLGNLSSYSAEKKKEWAGYFDSFQSKEDGLFYDPVLKNELYDNADWWGARHLALHMVSAYTDLGCKPKHPFLFLKKYYSTKYIDEWLDAYDWSSGKLGDSDIDNKIMNIGCLLQYQRDSWGDRDAGKAVDYLKKYLLKKINKNTGMWGGFDVSNPNQCSRMVQFAYHLFLIFFYDGFYGFDKETLVNHVLMTQNEYGGFGVSCNSSACEDIDSLDILIRFYMTREIPVATQHEVNKAIIKNFVWVLVNQADDGGFVFRLNEPFVFGHKETSSSINEGAMLPTWFRTLCIGYIVKYLDINNDFVITSAPGYEFK